MSPKRKGGAANKPSAPSKPVATTSKPPAPATAKAPVATNSASTKPASTSSAAPAVTSSIRRVSPPPSAGPLRPGVTIQANPVAPPPSTPAQPPKASAQPVKSALASRLRNALAPAHAAPSPRPGPSQQRTIIRSGLVRAAWYEFDDDWVKPRQKEIEDHLQELLKAAERTSKSSSGVSGFNKVVSSMRRDFVYAARAEWDSRLSSAGLQAEDWVDITGAEMLEVEQVLSFEESDDEDVGVYERVRRESVATSVSSGSTVVEHATSAVTPRATGGWKSSAHATQRTSTGQPLRNTQPVASRHPTATEVPEEPTKMSAWGAKHGAPILEDLRTHPKAASAQAVPSRATPQHAQGPVTTAPELLSYAVPVSLTQPPLDPALAANAEYVAIVDKLHLNSIRQFHLKAADADAQLAAQLRKPLPASDRAFTIRAHQMAMEQSAREIVSRRDMLLDDERKKRGLGGPGGDSAPPATVPVPSHARSSQPPGAFPEERARAAEPPSPSPEPEVVYEPEPEPEREPEPDVDEVIEIPLKGKGKKKGKKVVVETKPATNGRSTPTPAAPSSSARVATPVPKVAPAKTSTPASDAKGKSAAAPAIAAWNAARTSAPARAASPAPINTKAVAPPAANGRDSPAPGASSSTLTPWELYQAKAAAGSSSSAEAKTVQASNDIWAPPTARATSSKNPFAPSRPSRLAQVTQGPEREPSPHSPESPEPPSPPAREPTGQDYVTWFAGSSSEDESNTDGTLDEDGDEDEDEDDDEARTESGSTSGLGGLLASLAGASPWALFGEGGQPQRARAASPARGRGATPTPARTPAGRFTPAPDTEPAYTRWGVPGGGASTSHAHPTQSAAQGLWKPQADAGAEGDDLEQMLEIASSALNTAATGGSRQGGVNIEEAMAMYVTAAQARETLATPVGGRSGWRR
ncbi:hypothetical protein BD413DRAFT_616052 [Trametes elegans]|nr:hypothetical protein BD413DRAFT_616052 [Trametes elegans]